MLKTYFSNRIDKKIIESNAKTIEHASILFNRCKIYAYQTIVREMRIKTKTRTQSLHLTLKHRFGVDDYIANSALQEANALIASQKELNKDYIKAMQTRIKRTATKIKSLKAARTKKIKILNSIIAGGFKTTSIDHEQQKGRFFVVQFRDKTDLYTNVYDFEHLYLKPAIVSLSQRISLITEKLKTLKQTLLKLENTTRSVVFGSKDLFRAQHTTYAGNLTNWKKDFHLAKYGQFSISGRKDAKYGNFLFSYDTENQLLHAQLPTGNVVLPVHFPYGQSIVDAAVNQQINLKNKKLCGKPIAWSIEDHGTYFIIKIMVDVPEVAYANFSKVSGMIGTDCNHDHFAVTETNGKGQLVETFTLPFSMDNMSSGQFTKLIENKVIALVDHAVKKNKPIAVEKLNTTNSKASLAYGNKKANRKISQFAYDKMISSIKNRAAKLGVSVYEVNPAYTSQIAKMKYMKPLGTSIHQAAAYVIARRAMGFIEKVPPVLYAQLPEEMTGKHHWTHWSFLTRTLKNVNAHVFYASNFAKPKTLIQPKSWLELFDPRVSNLVRQGFVTAK